MKCIVRLRLAFNCVQFLAQSHQVEFRTRQAPNMDLCFRLESGKRKTPHKTRTEIKDRLWGCHCQSQYLGSISAPLYSYRSNLEWIIGQRGRGLCKLRDYHCPPPEVQFQERSKVQRRIVYIAEFTQQCGKLPNKIKFSR